MNVIMPVESQIIYNILEICFAISEYKDHLLFGFKYPKIWFDLYCIYAELNTGL